MRYFTGPSAVFDAYRAAIMSALGQPNGAADEPWPEQINSLALSPHEYEPPHYAAMISDALQNGIEEITEAEYLALQPPTPDL
jgi:hypothetical protein